jgi:iron complex outermembrane recepter protein
MITLKKKSLRSNIKHALAPLLYTTAILTPFSLTAALAAEPPSTDTEEITVTGSRIRTSGMESPNPITVITMEEVNIINPNSLIDGLAELPQFNGSWTTANFGTSFFTSPGNGTLNLRGLSGKRTLTLMDGRRVVSSSIFGGPSVTLFPQQLMRSVESVTGGATSAYGTDAVAGVVNYILNTDYEGFKANVRSGIDETGNGDTYGIGASGGFQLGQKAHILLSAETSEQKSIRGRDGYDWYTGTRYMDNTDPSAGNSPSNPKLLPRPRVVSRTSSLDGIIRFPQSTSISNYIMDANGNVAPYKLGTYFDADANSLEGGGSGTINDEFTRQFMPYNKNENYFAFADYDVTDELNVFFQGMYGKSFSSSLNTQIVNLTGMDTGRVTGVQQSSYAPVIFSGNPFIPANVQKLMTDNKLDYLLLGKTAHPDDLGVALDSQDTEVVSLTTGFNYKVSSDGFFNNWLVKGWYQSGKTDVAAMQSGGLRQDRMYLALDAVKDANGNTVCNVSRYPNAPENATATGCIPYNPFGRGAASKAAIDWVTGYDAGVPVATNGYFLNADGKYEPMYYEYLSSEDKGRIIDIWQDAWEIAADGEIFDGFGAGPVAMALGYAWREERFAQYVQAPGTNPAVDPRINPAGRNNAAIGRRGISSQVLASFQDIFFTNVPFANGEFTVKEAFTEFNVPLLKDLPFIQDLTVGASGRWANYVGTAEVWSWKGQFSWQVVESLRLRGTVSQDVRAANMGERFDRTGGAGTINDLAENSGANSSTASRYTVLTSSIGGKELNPEDAKTFTAGFVYQPTWLQGLQLSADWYKIEIKDNIAQFGSAGDIQPIIDGCYLNNDPILCSYIIRNGDASLVKPGLNRISYVFNPYVNLDWSKASGADFEASYNTDVSWFGGGERVSFRVLGSYLDTQSTKNGATITDNVGRFWAPWTVNLNGNYNRGNFSASLNTQYERGANANWTRNVNVFDVETNEYHYQIRWNGRVGYNFELNGGSSLNVGLNVTNLFNKDPQNDYGSIDGVRGDLRGRRYVLSANYTY